METESKVFSLGGVGLGGFPIFVHVPKHTSSGTLAVLFFFTPVLTWLT